MKKTLPLIVIASSIFLASQANAKTEGNYAGIDLIKNSVQVNSHSNLASDQENFSEFYTHKKNDSGYGVGINYKYAFNFDNFFIAPGVSYNLLNNEAKTGFDDGFAPYSQSMKLKSQLSFQTNFGYDITDQFSAYVPVGVSLFSYELNTSDNNGSGGVINNKKSGVESALFFGFGLAYEPIKNWVVNLEYNKFQSFEVTSATATVDGGKIVAKNNVDALKVGVSYKF
ncbi:MAG: outer membrane beta-barrel protein [Pseudomonadota bacterium]